MGFVLFMVFCGLVAAGIFVLNDIQNQQRNRRLLAQANYKNCLSALKETPWDADLRQRTLEAGRYYSELTREDNKVALFDEVALMNDINAACAGTRDITARTQSPPGNIEERFRMLEGLKQKGLIDEEAYSKRKSELLAQV